jgi:hypothetical protein
MFIETLKPAAAMPYGSALVVIPHPPATHNRAPMIVRFLAVGVVAGLVAAAAAYLSTVAAVPVWAMFMGWVAYFTRGHSGRDGLMNYLCLAIGLFIGFGAAASLGVLGPVLGPFTLPIVVFGVGLLVVSLRALPVLSNIPSYFLGLITVFAAHAAPTVEAFAELGGASAIGSFAAWLCSAVQAKVVGRA